MSKFLAGAKLTEAIASITRGGKADLAVAFWGRGACDMLEIPSKAASLRVACDARSGSCNPEALEDLLNLGAQIVDVPQLHAKVYIGSNAVVIASANASANGLGEEDDELDYGLEAGYLSKDQNDIVAARDWFARIFKTGTKITKKQLPELRKLWKPRRSGRPGPNVRDKSQHKTFLGQLLNNPKSFADRNFKVVTYPLYYADDDYEELKSKYKSSAFYDPSTYTEQTEYIPFYADVGNWNLKTNDLVLDFQTDGKKVKCTGVWRVQGSLEGGAIIPTELVEKPFGLPFPESEKRKIAQLAKALWRDSLPLEEPIRPIRARTFAIGIGAKD